MQSFETIFRDSRLCLVATGYLKDKHSLSLPLSDRPKSYDLYLCCEDYDYKNDNGIKKFSPICTATQAESDHQKPIYVVEKDGKFQTTQGYDVIYIGRVMDQIFAEPNNAKDEETKNFSDVQKFFLETFNNNKEVYRVFFERILLPSIGSGIRASDLPKAQRALSGIQGKLARDEKNAKKKQDAEKSL